MVTRLLNLAGVYLGEHEELTGASPDNADGHWENRGFVALNDEVLETLGGGWDMPTRFPVGWESDPAFAPIRARASVLVESISDHPRWGWKDPRNSLTLPFWRSLVSDLRVVVCVRNPLEVFHSLRQSRTMSRNYAFHLWRSYYDALLAALDPGSCVFTHFEAYGRDPGGELRRVLSLLGMKTRANVLKRAAAGYRDDLHRQRSHTSELFSGSVPADVLDLYWQLSASCGSVYHLQLRDELGDFDLDALAPAHPATASMRLVFSEARIADAEEELESVRASLAKRKRQNTRLRARVKELESELAAARERQVVSSPTHRSDVGLALADGRARFGQEDESRDDEPCSARAPGVGQDGDGDG
jgi:hypothetical protein